MQGLSELEGMQGLSKSGIITRNSKLKVVTFNVS